MRKIIVAMLGFSLLAGCSTAPVRKTPVGWQEKLYHRFPCEVQDDYRILELFYTTNRRAIQNGDKLRFTSGRNEQLTSGTLKTSICPGLELSRVVPKKLKSQGIVGVEELVKLGDEDFINRLTAAVENSPHKSLLVLVFGYNDSFELTALKAGYFAYFLDINTPILLFDWPGDYRGAFRGYKRASGSATISGRHLGELLAKIIRQVKPKKLWVESSSLGCQVVCSAFETMSGYDDLADAEAELTHVFMAAPDVSRDEFNKKFKEEIMSLAQQLTVYVSSNDRALLMAQIIDFEEKLGRQKVEIESYDQFEEAKGLLYLKSLAPDRISIVDLTLVNKAGGGHAYYIETPEFYDDFYMRLFEGPTPHNRHLYLVNVKKGVDYWIIRSDK